MACKGPRNIGKFTPFTLFNALWQKHVLNIVTRDSDSWVHWLTESPTDLVEQSPNRGTVVLSLNGLRTVPLLKLDEVRSDFTLCFACLWKLAELRALLPAWRPPPSS